MPRSNYRFTDQGEIYELWDELADVVRARDTALDQYDKRVPKLTSYFKMFEEAAAEGDMPRAQNAWKLGVEELEKILAIRTAVATRRK